MNALSRMLTDKRQGLFIFSLVLILFLSLGILRSGFDTSLDVLMTRSDPYLQERDRMLAEFPVPQEISFAFVPQNNEVFDLTTLQALADLSKSFRQIPLAENMASILSWQSPYGEATLFERPLQQIASYTASELAERRERGLNDSFLVGNLISPQAELTLAIVQLATGNADAEQSAAIAEATLTLRDRLQADHPGVTIHVSSEALFERFNRTAMISDLTLLLPLILLLCSAIIGYSFRSISLSLCVLGIAVLTIMTTVGSFGWLGLTFNTISVMAPLVVVTIAVADSVHLISTFRQNISAGDSKTIAMQKSLHFNIRPITLATLTTAIGFASLNLASSPAISTFGSVIAVGVMYAYVLTLFVLPALVLALPAPSLSRLAREGAYQFSVIDRLISLCQLLTLRHGNKLLWSVSLVAVIALLLSLRNETDFDRMSFIGKDSPLHDFYAAVSNSMDRGPQLIYGVEVANEYGVIEPQFLQQLDSFSHWLRAQPEILSVTSLVEVVKTVNQVMQNNLEEAYRIPDNIADIEQNLLDYQMVQARGFTLDSIVNEDFSLLRLFVSARTLSNQQIIELNERIGREFTAQLPAATLLHGSSIMVFARMDRTVTIELLQGYGFSLLLITLTLMIGLRSIRYGLLSVLPNLLPAVLVFGAWGLLVGELDPFVMMLFSISIGLVVDDTVHVLSTYQNSRNEGFNEQEAVNRALHKAGPALIITTAVMAFGTCVLIGASTLYFQQAATLLVPIVTLALVLDLTYFPALLVRLDVQN